jgi:deoxyribodipyrimidine photo-lyase
MPSVSPSPALVWFRDDLRLDDNPALLAAAAENRPLVLLHLLDDESPLPRPIVGAARWWLHHSLDRLSEDLNRLGQRLILRRGAATEAIPAIAAEIGATIVFWNRRTGSGAALDSSVEVALGAAGITTRVYPANLMFAPERVRTKSGEPFRVFTPFWRAALASGEPDAPVPAPRTLPGPLPDVTGESLESLGLLPTRPDWSGGLRESWTPGEAAATHRLTDFIDDDIGDYAAGRDLPAKPATSLLSPHLRFGEISPRRVWAALDKARPTPSVGKFRAELGWREFAWHVLAEIPDLHERNFNAAFDRFPWRVPEPTLLQAWQRGRTGYPIVDAGMRQLWHTGWMHNRVRMIVASFLTKHLLIDWRIGERWFWDTLVDADPASNPFGWQWVAGSGADAQPYFRIFNPVLQGEKFDADGIYVRRWIPEIAQLPNRFLHKPWEASPLELSATGIALDRDYPAPIVEHAAARARALAAYDKVKGG